MMTEHTNEWREIFGKIIEDNGYYEFGKVNFYNLTSILEELYLQNKELQGRIESLEKSKTDVYNDLATSMKQAAREVFGNDD